MERKGEAYVYLTHFVSFVVFDKLEYGYEACTYNRL